MSGGAPAGERPHFAALESLYAAAPIERLFTSRLDIPEAGIARIHFGVDESVYHTAGAHDTGTSMRSYIPLRWLSGDAG